MRNASLWVVGSGLLFALVPVACGDDTGSGGSGGGATVATTAATKGSTGVTAPSATTGQPVCDGSFWGDTCGACLQSECCMELADSNGAWSADVEACAESCVDDCFGVFDGPECSVPTPPAAAGACAAPTHDCNPVTQEPCNVANGEACDINFMEGKFVCYPAPNDLSVCTDCPGGANGDIWCAAGYTCIDSCAKYCCEDSDCGPGTCSKGIFFADINVGICNTDGNEGGGGPGGGGGAGGGPAAGGGGAGGN